MFASKPSFDRVPARVLGCLRRGELTIVLLPGSGMANGGVIQHIPISIVPFELRMPNSALQISFDKDESGLLVRSIERKDESKQTG